MHWGTQSPEVGTPRVVVGIDGSSASRQALARAIDFAKAFRAEVDVIIAWDYPNTYGFSVLPPEWNPESDAIQAAQAVLNGVVGAEQPDWISARAVNGHAPSILLEAGKGAALLVIGTRGHTAIAGALGSVSLHIVAHATCPVLVVPELPVGES